MPTLIFVFGKIFRIVEGSKYNSGSMKLSGQAAASRCEGFPFNLLKPNYLYRGRTAPLTSKRCIVYIYSTNIDTEYFKRGIHSVFFSSSKCSLFHNSNVFGSCIIHILYTECAKI